MQNFHTAIFDYDGVVADTETVFADFDCALLNDVLVKAGLEPALTPAEVRKLAGNSEIKKLEIIAQRFGFEAELYLPDFKAIRDEKRKTLFRDHRVPFGDGLKDFVAQMDRRCALASNKSSGKLFHDMGLMGITDLFDVTIPCDPPFRKKPEPDILIEAAKQLNAAPQNCIYIGDNTLDMMAAKAAGMTPVGFVIEGKDGHQERIDALNEHGAAIVVDSFADLTPYIEVVS